MAPINTASQKSNTNASPANSGNVRSYRRDSTGLFSSLINQKRNSSDGAAQARRASFNDMKPKPSFIGELWNKYVMGPSSSN